ncbi:MAG: LysR family transcriptional regulator [Gammaproteobacteria bacterium]
MARHSDLSSDDLRFFVAVARSPSLAAASRSLDVSRSAVTQRLNQLESRLRCRLVDRTTRHLRLTEEGHLLLDRARIVLEDLDQIFDMLGERRDTVSGHLRIAAPLGFGRRYIAPIAAAFRKQNPAVTITLTLTDRPAVADEHNWDLIVHIGELKNSSLVMVRLAANDRMACASPAYLKARGEPAKPADLASHTCLALRQNDEDVTLWRFVDRHRKTIPVRIAPAMSSNDGEAVRAWALAGLGVMVRSEWDVADDVTEGRLKRVLSRYRLPAADVVALLGKRGGRTARANAFLSLLQEHFRPNPWRPAE